jgi:hypothetical protein
MDTTAAAPALPDPQGAAGHSPWRLCIAPMMDRRDFIGEHVVLYHACNTPIFAPDIGAEGENAPL